MGEEGQDLTLTKTKCDLTLKPLLRLPELLQFREVLVQDEHLGQTERCGGHGLDFRLGRRLSTRRVRQPRRLGHGQ